MRFWYRILAFQLIAVPALGTGSSAPPELPEVYVRENIEARGVLDGLGTLEAEHRWGEAVEGYDRLMAASGDELVRVDSLHYRRIGDVVRERVSAWPAVAQDRYRQIIEGRAARQLRQIGDTASREELLAIAGRFWLTPAGQSAARRAIGQLQRQGRSESAASLQRRMGLGMADAEESSDLPGTPASDPRIADWPMLGGHASRDRIAPALPPPAELFWSRPLPELAPFPIAQFREVFSENGRHRGRPLQDRGKPQREVALNSGSSDWPCEMVAAEERVYVQTAVGVYALELNSGRISWCYPSPQPPGGAAVLLEECGFRPASPLVAGDRVYANLMRCGRGTIRESRLVCLRADDGKVVWEAYALQPDLGGRHQPEIFFDGTPLLYEGSLYAIVRRRRELTFEDCRLICLNPATGEQRWEAWIASGPTGEGRARMSTRSAPAGWGGDVFVQSNVGAVACVDGLIGTVRWVTLDPSPPFEPASAETRIDRRFSQHAGEPLESLSQPVVVATVGEEGETCMLTVPARSGDLVTYDVETGRETRRLEREWLGGFRFFSGPGDGVIYAVGSRAVAWDLVSGVEQWNVPLGAEFEPAGRPLLAEDRLWWPTRGGLGWLNLEDGERGRVAWPAPPLPGQSGPMGGNLLATGGLFLLGGSEGVHALAPAGEGLDRLLARTQRRSGDAAVWLDLAQFALARPAERTRGLDALDRATEGLARDEATSQPAPAARTGLAVETMGVILELVRGLTDLGPTSNAAFLDELLIRASRVALKDEQRVSYRLAFADAYARMDMPAEALGQLQQILDEPALRRVRIEPDALPGSRPAGRAAEERIGELIRRHGREIYAASDGKAEHRLKDGSTAGDSATLREALERYANAEVFPELLLGWLELERQAGRSLAAVRYAQHAWMLRRAALADAEAAIIGHIASGYLDAGDPLKAMRWSVRGERDHPNATWTAGGRRETFESIRDRASKTPVRGHDSPAIFVPPLEQAYELKRAGALVLRPREGEGERAPIGRPDPLLLFTNGRIEAIDPATGDTIWDAPSVAVGTPTLLGARGGRLILYTRYQLFAMNGGTGELCWTVGEPPPLATSPAIDPEILTHISSLVFGETLAVALLSDGRGVATDVFTGEVLWEVELPWKAAPGGDYALNDERLIYAAQGEPRALIVLDAITGREVGACTSGGAGQISWCGFSPERNFLAGGTDWLACFDAKTLAERWRVDGLKLQYGRLIQQGTNGLLIPGEAGVVFRSYDDGQILWQRDVPEVVGGAVRRVWLDGGMAYVLTDRGIAGLDGVTGEIRWASPWVDEGLTVESAWLTAAHLVTTGIRVVRDPAGGVRWEMAACWLDRQEGRPVGDGCRSLGDMLSIPDTALYAHVLLLRSGPMLTGWTGDENPPYSIDRGSPDQ